MKNAFLFVALLIMGIVCVTMTSCGDDDGNDNLSTAGEDNTTDVAVTGSVIELGSTYAVVNGTVNLNVTSSDANVVVGVEVSKSQDFTVSARHYPASVLEGRSFSVRCTSLSPQTQYWYRTYVSISSHAFEYVGKKKTFTTPERGGTNTNHAYVDLGLPSGTLWATCNIGADNPEDYGDYFAWGETVPYGQEDRINAHNYATTGSYTKTTFNWGTYKYCSGTYYFTLTKYCNNSDYGNNGFTDTLTELELDDDAAYVNWGSQWRMPSKAQQDELRTECTWTWTTQNGKNGYNVVGPNGNSLFLPTAGYRYDSSLSSIGTFGGFWSRTLYTSHPNYVCILYFGLGGDFDANSGSRCYGLSVRPVRKQ